MSSTDVRRPRAATPAPVVPSPALRRSALVLIVLSFAGLWAAVLPFVVTGHDVSGTAIFLGRLIPLLASLAAWRLTRPAPLGQLWRTSSSSARALVLAAVVAVVVMASRDLIHVLVLTLTGTSPEPGDDWVQVVLLLLPVMVISAVSTFGEEVAWRGHLRTAWEHRGFWPSAVAIATVWLLFHTPIVVAYHVGGVMDWRVNLATWLSLGPVSILLCALVDRLRVVWVAVLAHAFPFGVLQQQLLPGAERTVDGTLVPAVDDLTYLGYYGALAAITLLLAVVVRHLRR